MNVTFIEDKNHAVGSPIEVVEGSSITLSCTFWDDASSPSAKASKNNQDITATVFPTNTPTASGNVVTLSPATGLVGASAGAKYVIAVTAVVDGDTVVKQVELIVSKDETEL